MKIALLGATGFVGSALLKEALDRGRTVTAIVRHAEQLEERRGSPQKRATSTTLLLLQRYSRATKRSSVLSILDGRIRISITTRSGGRRLSSPPSRRRASSESSG